MNQHTETLWPGWETVRLIGRGGFGAVYEIQRKMFSDTEQAALKVISIPQNESDIDEMFSEGYDSETITSTFQTYLENIVAEYSLMRKLNGNSNIVNCDDFRYVQHDDGIGWDIFIKMELLTALPKVLPAQIPEDMIIKIGRDICAALDLCSEHKIIHRDIKPQNIFVSKHGDYKLGDFGIAKTVEKTMGGTKIGTYKYMAPEVYNNQPYGTTADIYSLGLVLYWMLNEKRMPFLPLPPEKLRAGAEEEARSRRFAGEAIPEPAHGSPWLKKIVLKAIAFDPQQRYQTAREMRMDLMAEGREVATPTRSSTFAMPTATEPEEATALLSDATEATALLSDATEATALLVEESVSPVAEENTMLLAEENTMLMEEPAEEEEQTMLLSDYTEPRKAFCTSCGARIVGNMPFCTNCGAKQGAEAPAPAPVPKAEPVKVEPKPAPKPAPKPEPKAESKAAVAAEPKPKRKKVWIPIVIVAAVVCMLIGILVPILTRPKLEYIMATAGTEPLPVGKTLTDADVQVYAYYSDDTTEQLYADFQIVDPVVDTFGTQEVTVTYEGLSTTFTVYGVATIPYRSDAVTVSAGEAHSVAIRENGTVVAVGYNEYGQCDVRSWQEMVMVSTGVRHTVGMTAHGTALAAGDNFCGQCDVESWQDLAAISAGYWHTVGLRKDGTVIATGSNDFGQCNVKNWKNVVTVSAGNAHTVALLSDGTVIATGSNEYGQCNVGGWTDIVAVSAGLVHTVGLKSNGTVVAVGLNDFSQCEVNTWQNIVAISAGAHHTLGLTRDGFVVAVGSNKYGQCQVMGLSDVIAISASNQHALVLRENGAVVALGNRDYNRCDTSGMANIKMK